MSNRNLTHIALPLLGARLHAPRSLSTSIAALLRAGFRTITAWLRRRRERERLLEFSPATIVPRRISDIRIGGSDSSLRTKPSNPGMYFWIASSPLGLLAMTSLF